MGHPRWDLLDRKSPDGTRRRGQKLCSFPRGESLNGILDCVSAPRLLPGAQFP